MCPVKMKARGAGPAPLQHGPALEEGAREPDTETEGLVSSAGLTEDRRWGPGPRDVYVSQLWAGSGELSARLVDRERESGASPLVSLLIRTLIPSHPGLHPEALIQTRPPPEGPASKHHGGGGASAGEVMSAEGKYPEGRSLSMTAAGTGAMCLQAKRRQGTLGMAEVRQEAPSVWFGACGFRAVRGALHGGLFVTAALGSEYDSENKNGLWILRTGKHGSSQQRLETWRCPLAYFADGETEPPGPQRPAQPPPQAVPPPLPPGLTRRPRGC